MVCLYLFSFFKFSKYPKWNTDQTKICSFFFHSTSLFFPCFNYYFSVCLENKQRVIIPEPKCTRFSSILVNQQTNHWETSCLLNPPVCVLNQPTGRLVQNQAVDIKKVGLPWSNWHELPKLYCIGLRNESSISPEQQQQLQSSTCVYTGCLHAQYWLVTQPHFGSSTHNHCSYVCKM